MSDELGWAREQLAAADAAGARLVLQPVTNTNSWTGGVAAHVGMRVRTNPAVVRMYAGGDWGKVARWGLSQGCGTVVGTCDDNSELRVAWDSGRTGSCIKAGKRDDFWLMTV